MVEIEVNQKVGKRIAKTFWLRLAKKTFQVLNFKKQLKVSLAIIAEEEIKRLNKAYRSIDKVTDVLSFSEKETKMVFPGEKKESLGEILICYPQALRQAKENKKPLKEELALLFVHGLLHLLGYDHKKEKEARKMRQLEEKILSSN